MAVYLHHAINGLCKAGNFVVQNYAPINAAYESTQSAALYEGSRDIQFFDTLYKANALFKIADLSCLFIGTYHFLKQMDKKYRVFHYLSSLNPVDQPFVVLCSIVVFTLAAGRGVRTVNLIMKKWSDPSLETTSEREEGSKKETLKAELNKPLNEKIRQLLFVSKIIINLSLLFFGPANPLLAISIAAELTSLGIITARKWLKISKEIDYGEKPLQNTLSHVYTSVYFLMYPFSNSQNHSENTQCTICLDKPETIDTYYCLNHVYHSRCIVDYAKKKMDSLINEMRNIQRTGATGYTISISKSAKISCPNCQKPSSFNSSELELNKGFAYVKTIDWV